jgi:hypothetical protein
MFPAVEGVGLRVLRGLRELPALRVHRERTVKMVRLALPGIRGLRGRMALLEWLAPPASWGLLDTKARRVIRDR